MEQALTPSLWAACAVLYQLSYWSTWELVIKWVCDQPVEDASGCTINYMGKRYINCALEYKVVVTIAVIIIIISDKQVLHIYTFWALCNFLGEEDHCPPPPPPSLNVPVRPFYWLVWYQIFLFDFPTNTAPWFLWKLNLSFARCSSVIAVRLGSGLRWMRAWWKAIWMHCWWTKLNSS